MRRFQSRLSPYFQARVQRVDELRSMFDNMASSTYFSGPQNSELSIFQLEQELDLIFDLLISRNREHDHGNNGRFNISQTIQNVRATMIQHNIRAPATIEQIDRLPIFELSEEHCEINSQTQEIETPLCIICLEEIPLGTQVILIPCQHIFHVDCLRTWLSSENR